MTSRRDMIAPMRSAWSTAVVIGLAGCGGDDGDPFEPPPGWRGEPPPACDTTASSYLIDVIDTPENPGDAEASGRDLDGDGTSDNQLGSIIASLQQTGWFDIQGRTEDALAADALLVGLTVEQCADPRYTTVALHRGSAVDRGATPPVLTVAETSPIAAVDRIDDLRRLALLGQGRFPPTALFDADGAVWIDAWTFDVELERLDDGGAGGTLQLGLDAAGFHDAVLPVIATYVNETVAGQPGCPQACEDDDLAAMINFFDLDGDDVVTPAEVAENSLIEALTTPDLDLLAPYDGELVYWPARDEVLESLSFGVGFQATPVTIAD